MLYYLLPLLIISILLQYILFIPAFIFKTDKLTDFSYSLGFIVLALFAFWSGNRLLPNLLLFVYIFLWALRLGAFLVVRISKAGKDKRFDGIREKLPHFLSFWTLQGITVFLILLPSFLVFDNQVKFGIFNFIGVIIWFGGLMLETVADIQKYKFKQDDKNRDKFITSGLWGISRHPNYLGEIMCWIGIYLFCFSNLVGLEKFVGLISPFTISILLLFISGIPKLEKQADEKWHSLKEYQEYKKKTPVLIPFIN